MPIDCSVKFFDSTMINAPILSGIVGSLIGLLDNCLVTGFNPVTFDSLVIDNNVATAAVSTWHGFAMVGQTGPVIQVSGATPAGLNVEWRVASVESATVFTFACPGIADGTASGTITAKRAPAGWTKPHSGTDKAAYLMEQIGGNPHYLMVDDSATVPTSAAGRWAMMMGYETMTTIEDTLGARFPTAAQSLDGLQVWKSDLSSAVAKPWWLVADQHLVYFGLGASSGSYASHFAGYCFGKTGSLRDADAFDTLILGNKANTKTLPSYPGQYNNFCSLANYSSTADGCYYARSYTQIGSSVGAGFIAAPGPNAIMGQSGFSYPYGVNNGILVSRPGGVSEGGMFSAPFVPGLYYPQHAAPLVHNAPLELLVGLEGKTLRVQDLSYGATRAQCLIDITGPWVR